MKNKIEIFFHVDDDGKIDMAKVRKIAISKDGSFTRFGLSLKTGEWLPVPEGKRYPDECIQTIPYQAIL